MGTVVGRTHFLIASGTDQQYHSDNSCSEIMALASVCRAVSSITILRVWYWTSVHAQVRECSGSRARAERGDQGEACSRFLHPISRPPQTGRRKIALRISSSSRIAGP